MVDEVFAAALCSNSVSAQIFLKIMLVRSPNFKTVCSVF